MKTPPGRNAACSCGSGKKYKTCCGRLGGDRQPARIATDSALRPLVEMMHAGRFAQLEDACRAMLSDRPSSGQLWLLLGVALVKQGKDGLEALRKAATQMPNDAVAHLNLGNAYGRRGQLEEALASYGRALSISPGFAEAHNNLADLLLELGRDEEALSSCRRALAVTPNQVEVLEKQATALVRLGRVDEALEVFRMVAALKPESAEAHRSLADALRSMGSLEEAIAAYRRAVHLEPRFVFAHLGLATALRLQRCTTEAEASCRAALALDPASAAALEVLAELRADEGRFVEAEQCYRRALVIDPDSAESWAGIARVRRMTAADASWLAEVQRLLQKRLPAAAEMQLRYAVGKYFDDVRDYDDAFANYRRANELAKRLGPRHDRAELSRTVDAIIHLHAGIREATRRMPAAASDRPVFIVGMLRSGTTLAEQLLAAHPDVFGAGELSFWGPHCAPLIREARALPHCAGAVLERTLASLGDSYLRLLQQLSTPAHRVVDKMPTNFLFLGLIHAALPNARIIHMQRDPLDTCLSIYFQRFEAANTYVNDLEDLAHYYAEYRRLMRYWRAALPEGAMLDVPYEGLANDPATWVRRMLEFVGLPWHSGCLDFQRGARTVITASKWQVRQAINTASIGRWRHYAKHLGPLQSLTLTPASPVAAR